jgi:glucokinase
MVLHAYNLGLDHVPLAELVSRRLGLPAYLENDANAAALGEFVAGAGRGKRSLVAVTLGTGVGVGAVLEGKLYTGFNYGGMEGGHMVIRRGGRPCTCGRKGCWEAYASATGLILSTREAMEAHQQSALWTLAPTLEDVTGRTAFDAAQGGDPAAQTVVDEYMADLACGVVNLVNLIQPEVFCLGGGVSAQGEALLKPIREALDREEFTKDSPRRTQVVTAQLGNRAGLIGGALAVNYR